MKRYRFSCRFYSRSFSTLTTGWPFVGHVLPLYRPAPGCVAETEKPFEQRSHVGGINKMTSSPTSALKTTQAAVPLIEHQKSSQFVVVPCHIP
jgi:hypothetical protein